MISLRPAVQADFPTIRRMVYQAWINPMQLDWRRFILALDEAGRVVGCAQVKPHGDGTRELASLVVAPEQRGRGIARQLVEALFSRETPPIYLTCASSLVPMYRKFGFRLLRPEEMSPYFRRLSSLVNFFPRLFRSADVLAVMSYNELTANG
jgi:GNAT superfamily N-acetyltransferase